MVGFDPAIKNPNQSSKLINPEDLFDPLVPEFPDFSLSVVDPFDFGSIDDWIIQSDSFEMQNEVNPYPNGSDLVKVDFGLSVDIIGVPVEEIHKEVGAENTTAVGSDIKMVEGTEVFDSASCDEVKMEKVNFLGISDSLNVVDGDRVLKNSEITERLPELKFEVNEAFVVEVGFSEGFVGMPVDDKHNEAAAQNLTADGGSDMKLVEARVTEASCIEAKMEKVSLFGTSDSLNLVNGDGVLVNSDISECLPEVKSQVNEEKGSEVSLGVTPAKSENAIVADDAESSDSDSESEEDGSSSTTSSSLSSSSDEDDGETVTVKEVEEGEIRDLVGDEMIGGSDDEGVGVVKGPIKSKNEIEVLPQVPIVDVTLEPNHQTLPVGVILSIMGTKVIVEGLEQHNPLNEGSILWITESRSLLGLVDEIFGPVKNPYYVVRYNSDKDVPVGIHEGTPVSFVAEFADHVLNDKNLYKKGYDASGENDEELSDEAEFSDDEKEAEYKKMQRMAKRGSDDKKLGNRESFDRKKAHNKTGGWKGSQPGAAGQSPHVPNQTNKPPVGMPVGGGGWTHSLGTGLTNAYDPACAPSISQTAPANCCTPHQSVPSNGVWSNGMPFQQQQNAIYPNGVPFPTNGMPYQQQQYQHQHQHQMLMGFSNGMPIPQQFDVSQGLPLGSALPYGQPNFSSGPPISMPLFMGQAGFNQTQFGMGFQGHHSHTHINEGVSHRPFDEQSHGFNQAQVGMGFQGHHLPTHINQGGQVQSQGSLNEQSHANFSAQQQFNQGATSARGRRPYQRGRGGGYSSRGRGRR